MKRKRRKHPPRAYHRHGTSSLVSISTNFNTTTINTSKCQATSFISVCFNTCLIGNCIKCLHQATIRITLFNIINITKCQTIDNNICHRTRLYSFIRS